MYQADVQQFPNSVAILTTILSSQMHTSYHFTNDITMKLFANHSFPTLSPWGYTVLQCLQIARTIQVNLLTLRI